MYFYQHAQALLRVRRDLGVNEPIKDTGLAAMRAAAVNL
jgi:hypothetical protein